jgi:hypothetical protein
LYRCETWYLTLRKEHGLRVHEKWVSALLFEHKWQKVTGDWRNNTIRRVERIFFIKYNSGHHSRRMDWVRHMTHMGEKEHENWFLGRKPEGKM